MTIEIKETNSDDKAQQILLLNEVLGPGRFARTTYRLREQAGEQPAFELGAFDGKRLVGTVTFTSVSVGGVKGACLLGPLVVHPDQRGNDLGVKLMEEGANRADAEGFTCLLLIGDMAYYERAGYTRLSGDEFIFPGPIAAHRILGRDLKDGTLAKLCGKVSAG